MDYTSRGLLFLLLTVLFVYGFLFDHHGLLRERGLLPSSHPDHAGRFYALFDLGSGSSVAKIAVATLAISCCWILYAMHTSLFRLLTTRDPLLTPDELDHRDRSAAFLSNHYCLITRFIMQRQNELRPRSTA